MSEKLRVVIADDERPARSFLAAMLRAFEDVEIVGEAETGTEAVELIEREKPDLALLDLNGSFTVRAEDLQYRHKQSPYLGANLRGLVRRTLVRGRTVFRDGAIVSAPQGRLIRPS